MNTIKNFLKARLWIVPFLAILVTATFAVTGRHNGSSGAITNANITRTGKSIATQDNQISDQQFFVRQNYLDFLNREPDGAGLNFWTNNITSCGANPACIESQRINTSAAFFLSIEFQDTGYLVYRTYKAAYGNIAGKPVPITRQDFLPDTQEIGNGVVVNQGNWQQLLENNKQAYFADVVMRERFNNRYPQGMSAEQFVDTLNTNAGLVLSQTERNGLVSDLKSSIRSRAQVLRAVAENPVLVKAEFNKAFVLMQYFGYLRRNPDDVPDHDFSGWQFWLNKLNQFNGNYIQAEMVKAFISSTEYIQRFNSTTLSEPTFTVVYPERLSKLSDDTSGVILESSAAPVSFGGALPEDGSAYSASGYAISIAVVDYSKPFSVTQYFNDTLGNSDVRTPNSLTVGGVQAYQTGLNDIGSDTRIVLVPYKGKVYDIEYRSTFDDNSPEGTDGLNVFSNFLQSFRFTQ